jgi:membrane protease YdiL (CAAX protease family)
MAQIATPSIAASTSADESRSLKPFGWRPSLLLFGIPTILMIVNMWVVWPAMMAAGMSRPESYATVITLAGVLLTLASLIGYTAEGRPLTWRAFAARFWLDKFDRKIALWSLGGLIVAAVVASATNALSMAVFNAVRYTPPDLTGRVTHIGWVFTMLVANIVGEELWWRGYIFPRQEAYFGGRTWLVHGLLWAFFHMFKWWVLPAMLIFCLIYPFAVQRTRSIWPSAIPHIILNGIGPATLIISQLVG